MVPAGGVQPNRTRYEDCRFASCGTSAGDQRTSRLRSSSPDLDTKERRTCPVVGPSKSGLRRTTPVTVITFCVICTSGAGISKWEVLPPCVLMSRTPLRGIAAQPLTSAIVVMSRRILRNINCGFLLTVSLQAQRCRVAQHNQAEPVADGATSARHKVAGPRIAAAKGGGAYRGQVLQ